MSEGELLELANSDATPALPARRTPRDHIASVGAEVAHGISTAGGHRGDRMTESRRATRLLLFAATVAGQMGCTIGAGDPNPEAETTAPNVLVGPADPYLLIAIDETMDGLVDRAIILATKSRPPAIEFRGEADVTTDESRIVVAASDDSAYFLFSLEGATLPEVVPANSTIVDDLTAFRDTTLFYGERIAEPSVAYCSGDRGPEDVEPCEAGGGGDQGGGGGGCVSTITRECWRDGDLYCCHDFDSCTGTFRNIQCEGRVGE